MAYSDETVLSKFSSLNESQEGIVTVAQWIMFHRRMARRTAELWFERVKESTGHRKLNMIYLANEVVQQTKARRRQDFLTAFSPMIADGVEFAYKGSTNDVQLKIRRVVQVWRQRAIFEPDIQKDVEQRLEDIDKKSATMSNGPRKLGGGLFGSLGGNNGGGNSAPLEFTPLITTHKALNAKLSSSTIAVGSANTDFQKQFDADQLPAAPVYAARLSSLLKTLDSAHTAVQGAIEAREAHIRNLEKLLEQSKTALQSEKAQLAELTNKHQKAEATKQEVEMMILKGMEESSASMTADSSDNINNRSHSHHHHSASPDNLKSPEIEELTPPHQVTYEPPLPPSASELHHQHSIAPAQPPREHAPFHQGASELLASLSAPLNNGGNLKRKNEDVNMFEGLDDDVADMFRNDAKMSKHGPAATEMDQDDDYRP